MTLGFYLKNLSTIQKDTLHFFDESGNKIRLTCEEAKLRNLKSIKDSKGSKNSMFKEMTEERKLRLFSLIESAVVENHLIISILVKLMKIEFVEFKKISQAWIKNNFGTFENLVNEYNALYKTNIKYNSYFRSTHLRSIAGKNAFCYK